MVTVIGNLKGGCGKSTITFNLAVWLAHAGENVVAFDLDPQATLSEVVELRKEEGVEPFINAYRPDTDPEPILKEHKGHALMDISASNRWTMRQAILMADRIVVPVPPSQADVWSTQRFLDIIAETVGRKRDWPEVVLFVNRADTHPGLRESDETEEALTYLSRVTVLKDRIGQRTAYRRSFSEGRAVFELSPRSKAAQEFLGLAKKLYPSLAKKRRTKRPVAKHAKLAS
ncbi:MAG: ParA family protein [Magnetococcales bacterium]|nr:ParA family protein [Magnetococcales bacterium]